MKERERGSRARKDDLRWSERMFFAGIFSKMPSAPWVVTRQMYSIFRCLHQPLTTVSLSWQHDIQDVGERLAAVHKAVGESELDLARSLDTCVHAEKIRELVVNEKSSLRELTIAVLMTHWDFIAPVFFYR